MENLEELRKDCQRFPGALDAFGYGVLTIGAKHIKAHRLAWALKNSGSIPPSDAYVLHRCDNKACINPDHLYLGSHNDNMRDVRERGNNKGTHRGEEHGNNKLTAEQVKDIKRRLANGEKKSSLAREYGVVQPTIKRIADGSTWSWLEVR